MKKEELLKKINNATEQINKFKKRLKTSDLCEELYDDAILQKAILLKELKNCEKNPVIESVRKGFNKILPKKKTLICDYFKN